MYAKIKHNKFFNDKMDFMVQENDIIHTFLSLHNYMYTQILREITIGL